MQRDCLPPRAHICTHNICSNIKTGRSSLTCVLHGNSTNNSSKIAVCREWTVSSSSQPQCCVFVTCLQVCHSSCLLFCNSLLTHILVASCAAEEAQDKCPLVVRLCSFTESYLSLDYLPFIVGIFPCFIRHPVGVCHLTDRQ